MYFLGRKTVFLTSLRNVDREKQGLKLEPEAAFSILVSTRGLKKKDEVRHF